MEYVDLRSDTVTKPTPEMREAMAEAEVGDDVYMDDPTVNQLQQKAAEMLGKEDALFVPSGTMGNLLALLVHCQRGDEVIVGDKSHIYLNEAGGMSALGGIHPHPIKNQADGTLALDEILASIQTEDVHHTITRLICLENTQNVCGGVVLPVEYVQAVGKIAQDHDLFLHMDGARIFNAAAALNVSVKDLVEPADSVMFCLSKGLVAPVGSMLVGRRKFITRARHLRKMLGGGMRQAGVLAAAGLISLEKLSTRLGQDHARAKSLYEGLKQVRGLKLDASPSSNMVYFDLLDEVKLRVDQIVVEMKTRGVLVDWAGPRRFRLVTHYWVDDAGVEKTVKAFGEVLK
ncbi:low-specificity L-threonine aldolase [Candidatus Villigracilis saccharophilus]|uniref:low-specificity L-threonine aldolase n=1 Tax=Candidatus Villigracilis saccharophilus TaxID=3140684 RepID=UPI003136DBA3|nr:low-specificity L-threonine aldolase [Anaerolineales bacterium]